MTERAPQPLQKIPQFSLLLTGVIAVAIVIGFTGGHYVMKSPPVTPQEKTQSALDAFRSGYDQTALSILTPLAREGNAKAQYWLADIYQNGLGVKLDTTKSIALLEKSAAQGFVPAERRLGELYLQGNETFQDFGKAQKWLLKAANSGDGEAQRVLGNVFARGLGVTMDRTQAYAWYENAALSGDGLAKHMRDDILTRMSPVEITQGEQAAKNIASEIKSAKT